MRLQDWQVRKAASKLNLTPGERLVLFTLNSYGENIFPTLKTALEDTGLSKQGYYNCRKSLENQGIILVSHQSTAKATEITINYPYLSTVLTSVSTELTNLSTELTPLSTEYEHNTNITLDNNTKDKTSPLVNSGVESQGEEGEPSTGLRNSTSKVNNIDTSNGEPTTGLLDSTTPGDNTTTFRLSTELTSSIPEPGTPEYEEYCITIYDNAMKNNQRGGVGW